MRNRFVVSTASVIWLAFIVLATIYCKIKLDQSESLMRNVDSIDHEGSTADSSSTFPDKASCISRFQSFQYRKPSPHKASSYLISRLRSYESLHNRCGPHTEPYNRAVKQLENGQFSADHEIGHCKYLVHLWVSTSGLGNRLLGLVSSFLYAILTNRVLLVELDRDMVGLFCEPFPGTTWVLPRDFPIKDRFSSFNQTSRECYGYTLKRKTMPEPLQYLYINVVYDYNDHDKLFFCDEDQNFVREVPWLVVRSDQYFVPSLFLISSFEDDLSEMFPAKDAVFYHLSNYILHPSNNVWGLVTRYYEAYLAKADERIGLQIRDFSSTSLPFLSRNDHIAEYYLPHLTANESIIEEIKDSLSLPLDYMLDRVLNCSLENNLLPKLMKNATGSSSPGAKKSKAVLLTSLNTLFFVNISNTYWNNPTVDGTVVSVHQPSYETYQQSCENGHNMKALAEMFLLSLTDELITSPWSSFGYVAQGLGGLKPWIINNPGVPLGDDPACYRAVSGEPCFHFPPFYDCRARAGADTGTKVPYVRHCEDTAWGLKLVDDKS